MPCALGRPTEGHRVQCTCLPLLPLRLQDPRRGPCGSGHTSHHGGRGGACGTHDWLWSRGGEGEGEEGGKLRERVLGGFLPGMPALIHLHTLGIRCRLGLMGAQSRVDGVCRQAALLPEGTRQLEGNLEGGQDRAWVQGGAGCSCPEGWHPNKGTQSWGHHLPTLKRGVPLALASLFPAPLPRSPSFPSPAWLVLTWCWAWK